MKDQFSILAFSISLFLIFSLTISSVSAQAPEFIFQRKTDSNGPTGNVYVTESGSWDDTPDGATQPSSGKWRKYSGTASSDSITLDNEGFAKDAGPGGVGLTGLAQQAARAYVKNGGTVTVNVSGSASVDFAATGDGPGATAGSYCGNSVTVNPPNSNFFQDSQSTSCNPSPYIVNLGCNAPAVTFPEYPGVIYNKVAINAGMDPVADLEKLEGVSASLGSPSQGTSMGTSTVTYSFVRGGDVPTLAIDGPLVGGVPNSAPNFNDVVRFEDLSFDPDEAPPALPGDGICSTIWEVFAPDDEDIPSITVVQDSTDPDFIEFPVNKVGLWRVIVTVIDNEGEELEEVFPVVVGYQRDPEPEASDDLCYTDSGPLSVGANGETGNIYGSINLSTETGLTNSNLRTSIHFNTQTNFSTEQTVLGNMTFPYAMKVRRLVKDGQVKYILFDGAGGEFDYGNANFDPVAPRGAFANLMLIASTEDSSDTDGSDSAPKSSGLCYALKDASVPERGSFAGNYEYAFNCDGFLTKIRDPENNVQDLTWNINNELVSVFDNTSKRKLLFEYDTPGYIARMIEPLPNSSVPFRVTHITYDSGKVDTVEIKDGAGVLSRKYDFDYNDEGILSSLVQDDDPLTKVEFHYTRNEKTLLGNISHPEGSTNYIYTEQPEILGSPGLADPDFLYRTVHLNAKSGRTLMDYDASTDLTRVVLPEPVPGSGNFQGAPTYTMTYDATDETLTSFSDGSTKYMMRYNTSGKLTLVEDQTGVFTEYSYSTTSPTDLTGASNNDGTLFTLAYGDSFNPHLPTTLTDGAGKVWNYTYNPNGQLITITPPVGSPEGPTSITYNQTLSSPYFKRRESITNGAGDVVNFTSYDPLGNLLSANTSPKTGVTNTYTFEYDTINRLTKRIFPDGKEVVYNYTGRNLDSRIDEALRTNTYEWCQACSKLKGIDMPLSKSVAWELDQDFDTQTFIDGNDEDTIFDFGVAKELQSIDYPDGLFSVFEYDSAGRMYFEKYAAQDQTEDGGLIGRERGRIVYRYDSSGRIDALDHFGNDQASISNPVTASNIAYDYTPTLGGTPDGKLYKVTDRIERSATGNVGTTEYTYNSRQDVETITYDWSDYGVTTFQTLAYAYYDDGSVEKLTWYEGLAGTGEPVVEWSYTYDLGGRLHTVTSKYGSSLITGEVVTYHYDGEGKLEKQVNGNGTSDVSETVYEYYEPRGWVTKITHQDTATSTPFLEYTIEYDNGNNDVGNITKVTELDGSEWIYSYDDLDRLLTEERTELDSMQMPQTVYFREYQYDLNNNITHISDTKGSAPSLWASYDAANKLNSIVGGDTTNYSGGIISQVGGGTTLTGISRAGFSFNPRGELVSGGSSGEEWFHNYDGHFRSVLVKEKSSSEKIFRLYAGDVSIGEVSSTNGPTKAFTWGADGLSSMRHLSSPTVGTGVSYFYHYGVQGETKRLTDTTTLANSVADYAYNAWGIPYGTVPSFDNPYRYGGKVGYYPVGNTGAYIAGARVYHPYIMRWLQRDPIGFDGGYNLYEYVGSNPVNFIDRSGLLPDWNLWYDDWTPETDPVRVKQEPRARQIEPISNPRVFTIYCKAVGDKVALPDGGGLVNAKELLSILEDDPDAFSNLQNSERISLICDKCGDSGSKFAQELADLTGKEVRAPQGLIQFQALWMNKDRRFQPSRPQSGDVSKRITD